MKRHTHEIFFAGGCFWSIERFMQLIAGVERTEVGYANSIVPFPSYELVCTGRTQAAEAVRVFFDTEQVDLLTLLKLFFLVIDPTSLNKQGNDTGTQYRTGIYYTNPEDAKIIHDYIDSVRDEYDSPIMVEVKHIETYYRAENYHQNYLFNKPGGYCHIDPLYFVLASNVKPKNKNSRSESLLTSSSMSHQHIERGTHFPLH